MIVLLVALAASPPVEAGLAAYDAGRYEESVRELEALPETATSYDALVALGVSYGRLKRLDDAGRTLTAAIALAPDRSEAHVERGGLRFLERRYREAADDLARGLDLRDDPYTRDLLATALYLGDRPEAALSAWNVLGIPTLRAVRITGLTYTRDAIARRELGFEAGDLLDAERLRLARRRLAETGVFREVELRPVLDERREATLDVVLEEKYAFGSFPDFAVRMIAHAVVYKVQVRYDNLEGRGVALEGQYRWQGQRPALVGGVVWPRPFGAAGVLHVQGGRERQAFALDGGPLVVRTAGLVAAFRHVLDARTAVQWTARVRRRTLDRVDQDARPGRLAGLGVSVERVLVDDGWQRADLVATAWRYDALLGSDLGYSRSSLAVSYKRSTTGGSEEGTTSLLAGRLTLALTGGATPVDEMFAAGMAWGTRYPQGPFTTDYPIRSQSLWDEGILGGSPISRRIALWNLEWRLRCWQQSTFSIWIVPFYDGAWTGGGGDAGTWHGAGVGVRLRPGRGLTLRLDWAYRPSDSKSTLSLGVGELF